ncbi:TRAP-type C4-dicarboxylate transport system permease large subunit [Rhodopirellula rubra]|uniref:TRAP-type C4-dicarboxylate transport system permease large subunit n=1 Tax=Aporhodopirellula rubra TaxID=980271 RepID=A0A7W5H8E0_9BACT|nr:TRAP transporter large permease [Aporhodopirellula rubra]MBB3209378.1 TRAP-type C4-dicarboxylate transport system permease large subunit [Aporhodopirellula rubra]
MGSVALILIVTFAVLLVLNVPIAVAIALASFVAILAEGSDPSVVLASRMVSGVNSFALLAIPFFILSGHLMGKGGLARRLIDFAATLVGRLPGGLGYVNTLTCMLFGSISGSAAAAVSSVGGFMIPEMNRKGYSREFNIAVTTTAATTGLMIPPSNIMIVYSVAAGSVSIAAMFMAGVLPGVLSGLCIMFVAGVISIFAGYRGEVIEMAKWKPIVATSVIGATLVTAMMSPRIGLLATAAIAGALTCVCLGCFTTFRRAFFTLLLIVIVIGGILGGIFTATEAAAIAVVYSFVLSVLVYREIRTSELPSILLESGITTAVVMLLIGASSGMSWIMTMANIPQTVSATLLDVSDNPLVILLLINLLLILVGTFMDMTPAVLIFTPIFLPVVTTLGMHPVHFGIMMIANLCIGLCTPPVGTCLFIGCGVGKTSIAKVTPTMLPFFSAMVVALMVITYVPSVSLWLPVQTKQLKEAEVEKAFFMGEKPIEQ